MCLRPPLGKLSRFQLGQPSQRHTEPHKAEAEVPAGWGSAEPPAPTCACTAAGKAVRAPRAGTHPRAPASASAPAPRLPSGGGAGCESPARPRIHPRSCSRQAAPAQHLQPGQQALSLICRAQRQRSARKGKPNNEEFGTAGLFRNHKQPSGGTKPALLYSKDKLSCWDSAKERDSDPTHRERRAKYRSHIHLDREDWPKPPGILLHLLCITGLGHTSRPPALLTPAYRQQRRQGGRSRAELTQSSASKARSQISRPYSTDLSFPWPNSPLVMG